MCSLYFLVVGCRQRLWGGSRIVPAYVFLLSVSSEPLHAVSLLSDARVQSILWYVCVLLFVCLEAVTEQCAELADASSSSGWA